MNNLRFFYLEEKENGRYGTVGDHGLLFCLPKFHLFSLDKMNNHNRKTRFKHIKYKLNLLFINLSVQYMDSYMLLSSVCNH